MGVSLKLVQYLVIAVDRSSSTCMLYKRDDDPVFALGEPFSNAGSSSQEKESQIPQPIYMSF
jgi:hypothetical protein